jgi:CHAT domain-containing protein
MSVDLALAIARRLGTEDSISVITNHIGLVYLFRDQYDKAIENFQQALAIARRLGTEDKIAAYLFHFGMAYYGQQQYVPAIKHLKESIELIEKLRKTATGNARRDYLASQIDTYQFLIASYILIGQIDNAFETMELSRAKLLAERLAGSKENIAIPGVSQVQQALRKSMAVLAYANVDRKETVQIAITSKTTNGQMVAGYPFWGSALKKHDSDVNALLGKQRGIKVINTKKENPPIEQAQKKGDLEKLINFYRSLLTNTSPENEQPRREIARALYDFLIKPMLPQIQGKKDLIIIPDGVLSFLPFETLIDEEGKYLIESYNITYAQSMGVMQLIKNRKYKENRKPLLAFGGAVYDEITYDTDMIENTTQLDFLKKNITLAMADTRAVDKAYASLGIAQMSNLPGTLAEAKALARIVPDTEILTGGKVSEDEVKSLSDSGKLAEYKVIHFATHGVVVPEFPELSALVLSQFKDKSGKEDGFLRMGEIAKLKLNADFVNLSACETGLGKIYGGEGVVGLTQSFLIAGANGLSVSLWQVDDQSTMMFMVGVYQLVNEKGMSYSQAINKMKRAFIKGQVSMDTFQPSRGITIKPVGEAKPGNLSHPYYWGPFVYYGKTFQDKHERKKPALPRFAQSLGQENPQDIVPKDIVPKDIVPKDEEISIPEDPEGTEIKIEPPPEVERTQEAKSQTEITASTPPTEHQIIEGSSYLNITISRYSNALDGLVGAMEVLVAGYEEYTILIDDQKIGEFNNASGAVFNHREPLSRGKHDIEIIYENYAFGFLSTDKKIYKNTIVIEDNGSELKLFVMQDFK